MNEGEEVVMKAMRVAVWLTDHHVFKRSFPKDGRPHHTMGWWLILPSGILRST